ncbi:MAG: hypothetical protein EOO97_00365 [Pedobacter sp.]|nr:MAG: hypothetical protein EOO97_00365 [Pedobacter sp.]
MTKTIYQQLKAKLNDNNGFDGGEYTNKNGITFYVNDNRYKRGMSFKAYFTIQLDKRVFEGGDLGATITINSNNTWKYYELENITPEQLWKIKDSYQAENEDFYFHNDCAYVKYFGEVDFEEKMTNGPMSLKDIVCFGQREFVAETK